MARVCSCAHPPEARTVAVRENMDPAAQVKTLAHELAHVVMHDPDDDEARQHRGIREVEAESVARLRFEVAGT